MTAIVNLVAFVLSVVFFFLSFRFPHLASDPGGLGMFPQAAAVVTAIACVLYLLQTILSGELDLGRRMAAARATIADILTRRREIASFILLFLMPAGIEYIGFAGGVFLFSLGLMLISGLGPIRALVASVITAVAVYVGYADVLGAVLPPGLLFGAFG